MTELVVQILDTPVRVIEVLDNPTRVIEYSGGLNGVPGQGVISGGTSGQVLRKASGDDYDMEWATVAGTGDMTEAIYDPQSIHADAFDRANHTGNQAISTVTGLQTALDGKETAGAATTALAGHTASYTHTDIALNTAARHTHSNITALNAVSGTNTGDEPAFAGAGADGLVPDPTTETGKFLRDDGTWQTVTTDIANDSITYAKIQNVSAESKLLGRGAGAGSGDVQEITLGTNLSLSGTTLNATGGAGTPSLDQINNPAADKTFTLTDYVLTFDIQAPPGHAFQITQTSGAPGAGTHLLHITAASVNVIPLHLAPSSTSGTALKCDGNIVMTALSTVDGRDVSVDGTALDAAVTAITGKQPLDATLTALAAVTTAADKLIYATNADTFTTTDLTSFGRSLLDDANAAAGLSTLGAEPAQTAASQAEAEAGSESALRSFSPIRVNQGIQSLKTRVATFTPSAGAITVDWDTADHAQVTITEATTFTFSNGKAGQKCLLEIIQDATGSRTATMPAAVKFGSDITAMPTLSTGASKKDYFLFIKSGSDYRLIAYARGY